MQYYTVAYLCLEYLLDLLHSAAVCDRCMQRITGEWFRCVYCAIDLCDNCEAVDTHNYRHFFMVYKSTVRDIMLSRVAIPKVSSLRWTCRSSDGSLSSTTLRAILRSRSFHLRCITHDSTNETRYTYLLSLLTLHIVLPHTVQT